MLYLDSGFAPVVDPPAGAHPTLLKRPEKAGKIRPMHVSEMKLYLGSDGNKYADQACSELVLSERQAALPWHRATIQASKAVHIYGDDGELTRMYPVQASASARPAPAHRRPAPIKLAARRKPAAKAEISTGDLVAALLRKGRYRAAEELLGVPKGHLSGRAPAAPALKIADESMRAAFGLGASGSGGRGFSADGRSFVLGKPNSSNSTAEAAALPDDLAVRMGLRAVGASRGVDAQGRFQLGAPQSPKA